MSSEVEILQRAILLFHHQPPHSKERKRIINDTVDELLRSHPSTDWNAKRVRTWFWNHRGDISQLTNKRARAEKASNEKGPPRKRRKLEKSTHSSPQNSPTITPKPTIDIKPSPTTLLISQKINNNPNENNINNNLHISGIKSPNDTNSTNETLGNSTSHIKAGLSPTFGKTTTNNTSRYSVGFNGTPAFGLGLNRVSDFSLSSNNPNYEPGPVFPHNTVFNNVHFNFDTSTPSLGDNSTPMLLPNVSLLDGTVNHLASGANRSNTTSLQHILDNTLLPHSHTTSLANGIHPAISTSLSDINQTGLQQQIGSSSSNNVENNVYNDSTDSEGDLEPITQPRITARDIFIRPLDNQSHFERLAMETFEYRHNWCNSSFTLITKCYQLFACRAIGPDKSPDEHWLSGTCGFLVFTDQYHSGRIRWKHDPSFNLFSGKLTCIDNSDTQKNNNDNNNSKKNNNDNNVIKSDNNNNENNINLESSLDDDNNSNNNENVNSNSDNNISQKRDESEINKDVEQSSTDEDDENMMNDMSSPSILDTHQWISYVMQGKIGQQIMKEKHFGEQNQFLCYFHRLSHEDAAKRNKNNNRRRLEEVQVDGENKWNSEKMYRRLQIKPGDVEGKLQFFSAQGKLCGVRIFARLFNPLEEIQQRQQHEEEANNNNNNSQSKQNLANLRQVLVTLQDQLEVLYHQTDEYKGANRAHILEKFRKNSDFPNCNGNLSEDSPDLLSARTNVLFNDVEEDSMMNDEDEDEEDDEETDPGADTDPPLSGGLVLTTSSLSEGKRKVDEDEEDYIYDGDNSNDD